MSHTVRCNRIGSIGTHPGKKGRWQKWLTRDHGFRAMVKENTSPLLHGHTAGSASGRRMWVWPGVPAEGLGARSIHATMLGVVGERLPLASTDNVAARNNRPLTLRTRVPAVQQGSEQRVHCRRPSFCVRAEDEAHWLEQHCQLWHLLQQPNARLGRHGSWQPGRHGRTPVRRVEALAAARFQSAVLACVPAFVFCFFVSATTPSRRAYQNG